MINWDCSPSFPFKSCHGWAESWELVSRHEATIAWDHQLFWIKFFLFYWILLLDLLAVERRAAEPVLAYIMDPFFLFFPPLLFALLSVPHFPNTFSAVGLRTKLTVLIQVKQMVCFNLSLLNQEFPETRKSITRRCCDSNVFHKCRSYRHRKTTF